MVIKQAILAFGILGAVSTAAMAQGTVRGAEEGAAAGDRAAGPVGGVVGGAVGAATGTVGGAVGVPADRDCGSTTVHHENAEGDSTTTHASNCP